MKIWSAAWVMPVSAAPYRHGAVAVESGRIVACGPCEEVAAQVDCRAEWRELGDAILLPGLVNAHLHLELSWMGGATAAAGDYVDWVRELLRLRFGESAPAIEKARAAAASAIEAVVAGGTVAVGDVANESWIVPLLDRSPLVGVVFHELYGFRGREASGYLDRGLRRLAEMPTRGGDLRVVLAPHAPHTTSAELMRRLGERAAGRDEPLAIHVAESPVEVELLATGDGPWRGLLDERGMWDDDWEVPRSSPLAYADRLGLLSKRTLAVHAVQLAGGDLERLARSGATVVTCPRSNDRLGVGAARVPEILAAGVPVALGTDSLASAPDLRLLGEMAVLRQRHPALDARAIVRMATLAGARALALDGEIGSIEPGKRAALAVCPLPAGVDDPAAYLCSDPEGVGPLDRASWEPRRR